MNKNNKHFRRLLVEYLNIELDDVENIYTDFLHDLKQSGFNENKLDHYSKIFCKVLFKHNMEKIHNESQKTYTHPFLKKYRNKIINLYRLGYMPIEILKHQSIKHLHKGTSKNNFHSCLNLPISIF